MPTESNVASQRPSALKSWVRALEMTAPLARRPQFTLPLVIEERARLDGAAPALLAAGTCWSYLDLAKRARRYARFGLAQGLRPGDVVALAMGNAPEYLAAWLGLTRIGVVVALVNIHLAADGLAHALRVAGAGLVVADAPRARELAKLAPVAASASRPADALQVWSTAGGTDDAADALDLDSALAAAGDAALDEAAAPLPWLRDPALYIYTSGTTGLPKAASVSHQRIMQWAHWSAGMLDARASDRMYNCLPMYHSIGGVVATGALLVVGGSVVLRDHFSARAFWDEVHESGATLFQYIGELCRFLVHAAPHPLERSHRLRLASGNGLRPDVWEPFQRRFAIPQILEFYAATEANFSLYNVEGKPGAIGRVPPFLSHRFALALVKVDETTLEPVRGADGLCVPCAPDEPGEALGRIGGDGAAGPGHFEGYTDVDATRRKVLHDVLEKGDAWFRSGDLMRRDGAGFYYFVDRLGDTFRWKGENVATTEVAEVLSGCDGVETVLVYGVAVPGSEGKAGMAALVTGAGFSVARLWQHASERLPEYARPVFLRILPELEVTGTFKLRKHDLALQGYATGAGQVYVARREAGRYERLDAALLEALQAGAVRL